MIANQTHSHHNFAILKTTFVRVVSDNLFLHISLRTAVILVVHIDNVYIMLCIYRTKSINTQEKTFKYLWTKIVYTILWSALKSTKNIAGEIERKIRKNRFITWNSRKCFEFCLPKCHKINWSIMCSAFMTHMGMCTFVCKSNANFWTHYRKIKSDQQHFNHKFNLNLNQLPHIHRKKINRNFKSKFQVTLVPWKS